MLSPNRLHRRKTSMGTRVAVQQQRARQGLLNFKSNRRGRYGEICWSPNGWTVCCSYPGLPHPICARVVTG